VTIQELLAQDADARWGHLRTALSLGALRACRRAGLDPTEAEDIAQEGLVRAARARFAALREAVPSALLSSWTRGMARNLVREKLRTSSPVRFAKEPTAAAEAPGDVPAHGWNDVDLSALTDKEQAALHERIAGRSEREAACRLRISRAAFCERMERAVRRLKRIHGALPRLPDISRGWAKQLLGRKPSWLRSDHQRCLRLYIGGMARGDIARATHRTVDGVHGVLGRLKRRFVQSGDGPTPGPRPTGPARTRGPSRGRAARSST